MKKTFGKEVIYFQFKHLRVKFKKTKFYFFTKFQSSQNTKVLFTNDFNAKPYDVEIRTSIVSSG